MRTEEWIKSPDAWVPALPPEWEMTTSPVDFEEKERAFCTPNGRLMTCAHRGDRNEIYPENSLEGFMSAIWCGADMVEADIHTAADGTLVVMHDDTLTRTTNLSFLRAAGEKWMPDSDEISQWTADQIARLRLIMPSGEITPCAVPTLEQLILLVKDRVFLTLDKAHAFSFEQGVLPLLKKHNAYRCVLIPYEYDGERVVKIQSLIRAASGQNAPFFAKIVRGSGIMDGERMLLAKAFLAKEGMPPVLRGGEFLPEEQEALAPALAEVRGTHRIYAETLREPHDNADHWRQMADRGFNLIMGNHNYALIRFAREFNESKKAKS